MDELIGTEGMTSFVVRVLAMLMNEPDCFFLPAQPAAFLDSNPDLTVRWLVGQLPPQGTYSSELLQRVAKRIFSEFVKIEKAPARLVNAMYELTVLFGLEAEMWSWCTDAGKSMTEGEKRRASYYTAAEALLFRDCDDDVEAKKDKMAESIAVFNMPMQINPMAHPRRLIDLYLAQASRLKIEELRLRTQFGPHILSYPEMYPDKHAQLAEIRRQRELIPLP